MKTTTPSSLLLLLLTTAPALTAAFSNVQLFAATRPTTTQIFAATIGPIARAKKIMDPEDYNRVVEQKMKQEKLTREQAEQEYNNFLENPSFYYALDKKEEYYKSLGYKDIFEGMIGEAEKAGNGEEVRERIGKFKMQSQIKAYSVIALAIASFLYVRTIYLADPENFLPGI